jgi:hypothetical protein
MSSIPHTLISIFSRVGSWAGASGASAFRPRKAKELIMWRQMSKKILRTSSLVSGSRRTSFFLLPEGVLKIDVACYK